MSLLVKKLISVHFVLLTDECQSESKVRSSYFASEDRVEASKEECLWLGQAEAIRPRILGPQRRRALGALTCFCGDGVAPETVHDLAVCDAHEGERQEEKRHHLEDLVACLQGVGPGRLAHGQQGGESWVEPWVRVQNHQLGYQQR